MGIKWYNQDGLTVRFGPRNLNDDENVASQTSTMGKMQQLTLKLPDLTLLPLNDATGVAAGEFANSARLPAGATVQEVTIVTDTPAASAGAADILIGVYSVDSATGQLSLTGGDADGLAAAGDSALADFSVAGETMVLDKAAGAALIGKTQVGIDGYVAAAYATAVYTAGALTVIIDYTL